MAKVKNPLGGVDARGHFGRQMTFKTGGVVTRYFVPRDPKTQAQIAQREAFKDLVMSYLTREQADLIYSLLTHNHDDRYSLLGHEHVSLQVWATNGLNGTIPASTTYYFSPGMSGIQTAPANLLVGVAGSFKGLRLRLANAQPGSGSLVVTFVKGGSNTALTFTIAAGSSAGEYSDLSHSVSVVAGDLVRVDIHNNATGASAQLGAVSIVHEFSTTG